MSFRSLLRSAARAAAAVGFNRPAQQPTDAEIRDQQEYLACSIMADRRPMKRHEAQAMMLLAARGGSSRRLARHALQVAALAAGRHIGPDYTVEPRLRKASTARLAFWATDTDTPV